MRHLWSELRQPIGFNDPNDDELADFDRRFMRILLKHLVFLGWWSILCLLVSAGALLFSAGQWYYFLMMSFVWGAINFAVTWAIFVQGIFLMVQDSCFARLHHRNFRKAKPYLKAFFHGN